MKITETIERECCQAQDLRPYKGLFDEVLRWGKELIINKHYRFCVHCGQIWHDTTEIRPDGTPESVRERILI